MALYASELLTANPFPASDVLNLEGSTSPEGLARLNLCTYTLPAFGRARRILEAYLGGVRPDGSRAGAAMGISGEYGSGKTHLIAYLLDAVWARKLHVQQVYVRVRSSDFMALYKSIMSQIDADIMREANTKCLSRIAQDEARRSIMTEPATETLTRKPESVYEYLRQGLLSPSSIKA